MQIGGKEASGDGVERASDDYVIPNTRNNTYVTPTLMHTHNNQTNHTYLKPHQQSQSEPCDYFEQAMLPATGLSDVSGGGRDFCYAGITRRWWSDIVCRL